MLAGKAQEKWQIDPILPIYRGFDWPWLETQETPTNEQNTLGFEVETLICHIVPVSRAYSRAQKSWLLGFKFLRQDSEMTLPRGSVSDLPFSH